MRGLLRNPWFLAFVAAVVIGLSITALLSRGAREAGASDERAITRWKARTGVDLSSIVRDHPRKDDSAEALELDAIVKPLGLQLGLRRRELEHGPRHAEEGLAALREEIRAAIRAETTDPKALSASAVAALERHGSTLDAVAAYVEGHSDVRWLEDFRLHPRTLWFRLQDHTTMHRLLIGRAFLALDRGDIPTAVRMLQTSRRLNEVLIARQDLASQVFATGNERMQLALLRRARGALGTSVPSPSDGIRERYRSAMSAEAAILLAKAQQPIASDDDPADSVFRVVTGPKLQAATVEAVEIAAENVDDILNAQDGCAALAKRRRRPHGMFAGEVASLDAASTWRRFVVLELDRAITAAVLTGRTTSPCASVRISVTEQGSLRTVKSDGVPVDSESVVPLPGVVTTRLGGV